MSFRPGRQPDKPGTYRIRPAKAGGMRLSGVRSDGSRIRMGGLSELEAKELAGRLFPSDKPALPATTWDKTDDWGFPVRVTDDTLASVNQTLGIPSVPPSPGSPPAHVPAAAGGADLVAKAEKQKRAKSLMDMIGIAGAAGDVMLARKLCERLDKEPLKPDPKQVNDLRDSIKDTLTEWFGDREIQPWQMMILLGLGLPLTMLIQSPKRVHPKGEDVVKKEKDAALKSVP